MSKSIPQAFLCCITQQLMREPVIDPDGNSYEKAPRNGIFDITDTGPNGGRYANVQAIETVTGDIIIQRTMLLG